MSPSQRLFQLSGTCNNYPWGKKGNDSLAARLCQNTPETSFTIDNDQYYSEMWFGDYPDFPARDLATGTELGDLIQKDKDLLLGPETSRKFDGHLPFLPKILSIAKALPLQIHPDKELAAKLHEEDPENFTDTNHKPEISVALSEFELFVGWRSLASISTLFSLPSLAQFVPEGTNKWTDETLRTVVRDLLKADETTVEKIQDELLDRAKSGQGSDALGSDMRQLIQDLLPRLRDQYSAKDPGSLVALLCMNFLVLQPGESVWIPADGVHAYLAGDLVECMARSNNMLAAGLCPAADRNSIDLFARTLSFKSDTKSDNVRLPEKPCADGRNGHTTVYSPPISEFDMLRIKLDGKGEEIIKSHKGPKVAVAVAGSGKVSGDGRDLEIKEGYIFYVAPGIETTWKADGDLELYVATLRDLEAE